MRLWRSGGARPPGPAFLTPFEAGRMMRRDPLTFVSGLARDYGDSVLVRMGPMHFYMFFHPDAVKHVLQENHQNYVKGPIIARVKVLIGEGLFTSEGSFWRRQRRLAQPAFHRERIAGLVDTMVRCTAERLEGWAPRVAHGAPFDVAEEMSALTLTIVGRALFGRDLSGEAAAAGRALAVTLEIAAERAMSYAVLPIQIPTARNRAFRRARRVLDDLVYEMIGARRRSGEDTGDLLSMLMAARDEETGEGMTPRQLRDEVMTFFLAGHETTAVALSWTWSLLAKHPEVVERLRHEVAGVLGTRPPTMADLPNLPLCRMVVEEAMRLYPPVWGVGRQAVKEDIVGGYRIPAGTVLSLSPWVTHRHPDFWPDADRFDPDRFAPEQVRSRPKHAYFPFSSGPRLCIGETFALVEAQIVVAMMTQRYELALPAGAAVVPEPHLTLRPRGGLPMLVRPAPQPTSSRIARAS
jgi:cytochrome P450